MKCPRCKSAIGPLNNPDAIVTCPGCGTRLMTRSAALRSQGSSTQGTAPAPPPKAPVRQQTSVKVAVRPTTVSGKTAGGGKTGSRKVAAAASPVTLEMVLDEIRALRETQQQILDALGGLRSGQLPAALRTGAGTADGLDAGGDLVSPIRTGSQKSVVLVDDDVQTRNAAVNELEQSEIPVRAFGEAQKALEAIAEDKPAVIILELGVRGDLGGKDLVNMIKATMEWVDIRIVLWTREAVSNQKEARQIHGADEVVSKSSGAAALVARVIQVLRR